MLILCEEKGGDRMNLFFVFLGTAAWQDLRTRSISLEVLAGGAAVGIITCIWKERLPGEIVLAMIPGITLLLIGMLIFPVPMSRTLSRLPAVRNPFFCSLFPGAPVPSETVSPDPEILLVPALKQPHAS